MEAKVVTDELRSVRSICGSWVRAIEQSEQDSNGEVKVNVDVMRRELALCAAKLEAIVASES